MIQDVREDHLKEHGLCEFLWSTSCQMQVWASSSSNCRLKVFFYCLENFFLEFKDIWLLEVKMLCEELNPEFFVRNWIIHPFLLFL
jgi:hypothetical protein